MAFAHLNSNVFCPVRGEVSEVCPLFPSLKGYRGKNIAITFELYRERKCQLIVFETEVPRLIKYLILPRK